MVGINAAAHHLAAANRELKLWSRVRYASAFFTPSSRTRLHRTHVTSPLADLRRPFATRYTAPQSGERCCWLTERCLISELPIVTVLAILNPPRCGLNRDLPGLLPHQWSFSSDIAHAVSLGGVLLSMQSGAFSAGSSPWHPVVGVLAVALAPR